MSISWRLPPLPGSRTGGARPRPDVTGPQCREPVRAVVAAAVLLVLRGSAWPPGSCTMVARILSRESPGRSSCALTCFRIRGRALAEGSERRVLGLVAHGAPARVVAVLLATLAVPPSRLDVPVRPGAAPDVRPRRGHGKLPDPSERREVADGGAVLQPVAEATSRWRPPDSRQVVADVPQPRLPRGHERVERNRSGGTVSPFRGAGRPHHSNVADWTPRPAAAPGGVRRVVTQPRSATPVISVPRATTRRTAKWETAAWTAARRGARVSPRQVTRAAVTRRSR